MISEEYHLDILYKEQIEKLRLLMMTFNRICTGWKACATGLR
jgi:hypothetical protein